jgi:hypothetical protein
MTKMPAKKRTPEIERHVLELGESGMLVPQIAKAVGLSITTIREIFKRASKKSTATEAGKPNSSRAPKKMSAIPDSSKKAPAPPVVKTRHSERGRPPLAKSGEVKRTTTVAVLPSVYEAARKICYVQRRTISDVINGFLESFVAKNLNDLKKY